jgi:hypothetical protein
MIPSAKNNPQTRSLGNETEAHKISEDHRAGGRGGKDSERESKNEPYETPHLGCTTEYHGVLCSVRLVQFPESRVEY